MAIRSLDLRPDDEILTTNREHGAMDRAWRIAGPALGLGESSFPGSTKRSRAVVTP